MRSRLSLETVTTMRWLWRILAAASVLLSCLLVGLVVVVLFTQRQCTAPRSTETVAWHSIMLPDERRDEIDTYLTYPEWSIVYAYDDLAAVSRRSSESDFNYFGSIRQFWTSMCAVKRIASSRGDIALDYDAMLYIIGFSFTAEMAIQGAYEKTIGAFTAWLRDSVRTPEDKFALSVEDDYAHFLRQRPWYEYPFGATLVRFWREARFGYASPVRAVERRIALTLQYGIKAPYAKLIGFIADASPAPTTIRSVIVDLRDQDLTADRRIVLVRRDGAMTVIETPRYQELTDILAELARNGRNVREIAGNRRILLTVLSPGCRGPDGDTLLFSIPLQTTPGWCRQGLDVQVPQLADLLRSMKPGGPQLEHVFDY
jgi:hypothetical protein